MLRHKGAPLPIICPLCNGDVEHMLHIFFDCKFASQCWEYAGLKYDMHMVVSTPQWLIQKVNEGSSMEISKIVTILWGIWYWRNKRVWDDKLGSPSLAMDWSSKVVSEWKQAIKDKVKRNKKLDLGEQEKMQRWWPLDECMVIRDHTCRFIKGKNMNRNQIQCLQLSQEECVKPYNGLQARGCRML